MKDIPPLSEFKKYLKYDPETGKFIWLKCTSNKAMPGQEAGFKWQHQRTHYIYIGFKRKSYRAHRLAWYFMTGLWPEHDIDHIDRNGLNNKWNNLRRSDHRINAKNQSVRQTSKSGATGVCWDNNTGKWRAYICANGDFVCLGRYKSKQEAIDARRRANMEYSYHPNHGKKHVPQMA